MGGVASVGVVPLVTDNVFYARHTWQKDVFIVEMCSLRIAFISAFTKVSWDILEKECVSCS